MSLEQKIYGVLPAFGRNLAASFHGYRLKRWRYDSDTEQKVEQILERETWSNEQWKQWRENRLGFLLSRAAKEVPFYREQWAERRRKGDNSSWDYLENWNILEKQDVRDNPRKFVADDCDMNNMYHDHTSGTTGMALDLWLSRETVKQWYAMSEARWRRWYGVTLNDRWAILGGQLVTPVTQRKPPFWVWNSALNQLYMSSYHLSPATGSDYSGALKKHGVQYILGYSSALYSLAKSIDCKSAGAIKVVITNGEPLFDFQRIAIEEAFDCPVRETYGMAEMVAAASECEHGKLHQWPDAGVIEAAEIPSESLVGEELICTGLMNTDMPLIRYRVGDNAKHSLEVCSCGRTLPLLDRIDGRNDDVLISKEGRNIGRLDPIFKSALPILEAQIIQKSLDDIVVKIVPDDGFEVKTEIELKARIQERMGNVNVFFECVDQIPRTKNGKFRAVISEIETSNRA